MSHVAIFGINLASLRGAVDAGAYARGGEYARQRQVMYADWNPAGDTLHGVVCGHENKVYNTGAFFSLTQRQPAEFELGECSCPVEFNCKHVVALVLSVLEPGSPESDRPPGPPQAWSRSLDALLDHGGTASFGAALHRARLVADLEDDVEAKDGGASRVGHE